AHVVLVNGVVDGNDGAAVSGAAPGVGPVGPAQMIVLSHQSLADHEGARGAVGNIVHADHRADAAKHAAQLAGGVGHPSPGAARVTPLRLVAVGTEGVVVAPVEDTLRAHAADVVGVRLVGLETVAGAAGVGEHDGQHAGLVGSADGVEVGHVQIGDPLVEVVLLHVGQGVDQPAPLVGLPVGVGPGV